MGGLLSALIGQGVNLAGNEQAGQREARQLQLQQAINAAMMAHTFAKDEAQMGYERQRGHYYEHMANEPDAQGHVVDPVTGNVTFFDPRHPPANLNVNPKPPVQHAPAPDRTLTVIQDPNNPNGPGLYVPRAQAAGQHVVPKSVSGLQGSTNAAIASKAGQFGEMLKKSADLIPAMESLNVKLGQSAANDVASAHIGGFHIPGTQGVGNLMVNSWPEYQRYQTALTPFVLANAHALSGARINQEQANMIQRSVEMQPGDAPMVRQQRIKNVVDQLNSVAASLGPDAVAAQEEQMDPAVLQMLKSYGYRGATGRAASPSGVVTPAKPAKGAAPKADYGIFGGP